MPKHKMAVVQRSSLTSRRRQRPASASSTRATRTPDHTHENSKQDARLSSNIRAIEVHLQHLHEECMYLEAAKVQEELQKLKAQRHSQNTTYWVERHDKTIAGLRQQRKNLFSDAQQRMDLQLRQAHDELARSKEEMRQRHTREIQILRHNIEQEQLDRNRTHRPNSPSQKFSGKVLALLEKEKRLARSRFYERASKARKDAEKQMAVENEDRKLNDYRTRQGKLSKCITAHKEERLALQSNFEHERRKLVAHCRTDQKRITVRVRKTRSDLSRARSLRVAMGTSSSPVLSEAATKASMYGERSAATLPMTASPLRFKAATSGGGDRRARPRSAHPQSRSSSTSHVVAKKHGGRRRNRPQSAHSGGNGDTRRRARPSTAPSKRRGQRGTAAESMLLVENDPVGSTVVETQEEKATEGKQEEKGEEKKKEREGLAAMAEEEDEETKNNQESRVEDDVEELDPSHTLAMERSYLNDSRRAPDRRSQSAGRSRLRSKSKSRRRPKSAGRWRKRTNHKKKAKQVCWWCSETDGHIHESGGVAVPSSSNPNKGTGCFCSWECASSHVFKYFPIQDRWISDLLIQDTAGYLVRKSKRAHKRPQGPGIPSMDM